MSKSATAISKTEWSWVVLALVLLAAVALRPSIRGNDGVGNYVYLAALLRHGDLNFTSEYRQFDALKKYPYLKFSELARSPVTGRPSNRYGIGAACFWSPFVLAAHWTTKLAHPALANGLTPPYEWAVGIATAFWGSLGLALLYGRMRRRWPPLACAALSAGLILATPLGFYLYAHGSMSHGVSFFAAVCLMLAFEKAWRQPRPTALAEFGFWSAWLIAIRFQDATWVMVLGLVIFGRIIILFLSALQRAHPCPRLQPVGNNADESASARFSAASRKASANPLQETLKSQNPNSEIQKSQISNFKSQISNSKISLFTLINSLFFSLLGFFSVFIFQMAVWKYLYGSWLSGPMPYLDASAGSFTRWPIHLLDVLFSGRRGVLAWHPFFALGLAGLALLSRRADPDRPLAWAGLAGFAAQLWLVSCWSIWWAGASFGNRFFISSLPFIALGAGAIYEILKTKRQRMMSLGVLCFLILWNMGLLVQYATEMIPREDWVSWSRIVRQNLIDVPRLILQKLMRH